MSLSPQIQELAKELKEHLSPEQIVKLASEGNPKLSQISRWEKWNARSIQIGNRFYELAKDYEFVTFRGFEEPSEILLRCQKAVQALGGRLESCLNGNRIAKTFRAALEGSGPESEQGLDLAGVLDPAIYSAGRVPQLLGEDGVEIHISDGALQIRFGYYAQLAPKHICGESSHWLARDANSDSIKCSWCDFRITEEQVASLGLTAQGSKYDRRAQALADECTKLKAELTTVEVDNSRLRRQLERLDRK